MLVEDVARLGVSKEMIGRRFDDPMVKKDIGLVPYHIVRADNGDDDARTQAMRPGRAGRDVGTDGGASATRHGRGGDDDTEIIRRT
mgnify:CR=1 FL=1